MRNFDQKILDIPIEEVLEYQKKKLDAIKNNQTLFELNNDIEMNILFHLEFEKKEVDHLAS